MTIYVNNWILWHVIISLPKMLVFLLKSRRVFTWTERRGLRNHTFYSLNACKFQMKCAKIYWIPWASLPKGVYAVLRVLHLAVWFYKDFLCPYSVCEPLLDRQVLLQVVIHYFSGGKLLHLLHPLKNWGSFLLRLLMTQLLEGKDGDPINLSGCSYAVHSLLLQ